MPAPRHNVPHFALSTKKRPLSVTLIGWLYAAVGFVAIGAHITEINLRHPLEKDLVWGFLVNLIAILSGAFMLRGSNWARWLAMAWIAFHVVLSAFHSLHEVVVHALLFAAFAYFLFRRPANEYFRGSRAEPA